MSLLHPMSRGFFSIVESPFPHDSSDERAWGGLTYQTATGLTITPQTAFQVSCIFQGARLYGDVLGSMPLRVLRDLGNNHKEEACGNAPHRLLKGPHGRPNAWQTPQQFRATMTAWALLWPVAIAEIRPGRSGAFEELWPIEPAWVTPERIRKTNRLRFRIDEPGEPRRVLTQDEVFRLEGFGLHRCLGEPVLQLAREAIGLWLSHQKFQGLYFSQGAKPSVWLTHKGAKLDGESYLRIKEDVQNRYGGWHSHHKVAVLGNDMQVTETGWNARDSQMIEAKRELVEEIARWLNLPVQFFMLVNEPTHASAEVFAQQLVMYSLQPWATRWEECIARDLLLDDEQDLYVKHVFDSLLRGKTLERAQAYAQFIMNGVMSENECRVREDLDPWPGLDEPRRSVNQDRGADPRQESGEEKEEPREERPPTPRRRTRQPDDDEARAATHHRLVTKASAARVVRRELSAIRDHAEAYANDPEGWRAWVDQFYSRHEPVVAEALQLPPLLVREYIEDHRAALKTRGLVAAETWETDAVKQLVGLAVCLAA